MSFESVNPYESSWNRARDEAWFSDAPEAWEWASVCADRAAMVSTDSAEIDLWLDRCEFASSRARAFFLGGL